MLRLQLQCGIDDRVRAAAARIWLDADIGSFKSLSQSFRQVFRINTATGIQRPDTESTVDDMSRPGDAL